MPSEQVLQSKQALVEQMTETLNNAVAGVLVDYKGITVAQDTQLRSDLRKADIEYSVVKNTLMRRALDEVGLEELDSVLNGTTSLATGKDDPILPIRLISENADKLGDIFNVKAAFLEGKVLSEEEIKEIAALPSKDALYAQVFGTLLAPITSLAVVLDQIVQKQSGGAEAAEE